MSLTRRALVVGVAATVTGAAIVASIALSGGAATHRAAGARSAARPATLAVEVDGRSLPPVAIAGAIEAARAHLRTGAAGAQAGSPSAIARAAARIVLVDALLWRRAVDDDLRPTEAQLEELAAQGTVLLPGQVAPPTPPLSQGPVTSVVIDVTPDERAQGLGVAPPPSLTTGPSTTVHGPAEVDQMLRDPRVRETLIEVFQTRTMRRIASGGATDPGTVTERLVAWAIGEAPRHRITVQLGPEHPTAASILRGDEQS